VRVAKCTYQRAREWYRCVKMRLQNEGGGTKRSGSFKGNFFRTREVTGDCFQAFLENLPGEGGEGGD